MHIAVHVQDRAVADHLKPPASATCATTTTVGHPLLIQMTTSFSSPRQLKNFCRNKSTHHAAVPYPWPLLERMPYHLPHTLSSCFIINASHLPPTGTRATPRHFSQNHKMKSNALASLRVVQSALFYFRLLARSSTPSRPTSPQRSSGIAVHGVSISQLSSFPTLSSPAATAPIPSPRKFLRASPRITLVGGDSPPLAATPSSCLHALLVARKPRDCHDNAPRVTFSGRHWCCSFALFSPPKFKGTSLVCCARSFRAACFAVCCQPSAQILPAPSDEQGCPSQPLRPGKQSPGWLP